MSSSRRELMGTSSSMEQDMLGAEGAAKDLGAAATTAAVVTARAATPQSEAV